MDSNDKKPKFWHAALALAGQSEDRAKLLLSNNSAAMQDVMHSSSDCVHPDELTEFLRTGELTPETRVHLAKCASCAAIIDAFEPPAEPTLALKEAQAEWLSTYESDRVRFGLLTEPDGRWGSFGVSMVTNVVTACLLILFTAAIHKVEKQKYNETLIFPQEVPPPPKIVVPKVKEFAPPQPEVVKLTPPKITIPKIRPQPEIPKPMKMDQPEQPKLPPAPPKAVAPPLQPKVGLFSSPKPTDTANNQVKPDVKAGGFGDPTGAKTNPNTTKSGLVAVGTFNSAPGPDTGAGASRQGTVTGTSFGAGVANRVPGGRDMGKVASAGFANGTVGGSGKPGGTGTVASAGFSNTAGPAPTQVAIKTTEAAFVPPVVISEPHPQYTTEAARLRIQGEVTLQVRFLASGQVEVLRVVNGLGHGLDEEAKRVAEQIRFKPAEKDGHPIDHTTLIHVIFQLA
jgi:TonB family protein